MRIRFEVSGGYGGLFAKEPAVAEVETDQLPDEVRERLVALVESSGVLELKPAAGGVPAAPGPQRDVFAYRIAVDGRPPIAVDDVTAPAAVRPLLQLLTELTMKERAGGRERE